MTAYIHVPTVFLMLLLGYGLLALLISLSQQRAADTADLRTWNLGNWSLVGSFATLALRDALPNWATALGTTWLLYLGTALYCHAIYHFLYRRSAPMWLWLIWGLGCGANLLLLGLSRHYRVIFSTIVLCSLLLPALWHIVRQRHAQGRPLRLVGVTLAITVVTLCLRAAHAARNPQDYVDAMQISLGQGMGFVVAFVAMLGAGFGFVLAVLERDAERMHQMATHDGLTGCINRITFDALLVNAMERARRADEPLSLVMLDLDHFKAINDAWGHRTGDEVLRRCAATVQAQLRASDVLARVGGEEFSVLLPGTDLQGAAHVAETVRAAVQAIAVDNPQGGSIRVSVSAGVASTLGPQGPSADQLYQSADAALYAAKAAGRNRVHHAPVLVITPA
jgi:diguanylate cyclase (GGDEF)-like protein